MKISHLGLAALMSLSAFAQTSCLEDYNKRIEDNETLMQAIAKADNSNGTFMSFSGYLIGYGLTGTATGALTGYIALPILGIAEHFIEDEIHDSALEKMVRLIDESQLILKLKEEPRPRTDILSLIDVNGQTAKERRQQKRENRRIARHNKEIKKYNELLIKEKAKRLKQFSELLTEMQKHNAAITSEQLAQAIVDADNARMLCNGEIRHLGEDLTLNTNYVQIDGATKKERREQRRHNRKIDRENDQKRKKIYEKNLAKERQLEKYLKTIL